MMTDAIRWLSLLTKEGVSELMRWRSTLRSDTPRWIRHGLNPTKQLVRFRRRSNDQQV